MRDEGSSVYERHALGNGKRLTHADGTPIQDRTAELCDMARAEALAPVSEGEAWRVFWEYEIGSDARPCPSQPSPGWNHEDWMRAIDAFLTGRRNREET